MRKMTTTKTADDLPAGVLKSDLNGRLTEAEYRALRKLRETGKLSYDDYTFELWHTTSLGWCIPTLLIGKAHGYQATNRTYAVTLDGKVVRIGKGPHVTQTLKVTVRAARLAALQKFLDLRKSGAAQAGEVRDRISSRRAQGQIERAAGRSYWKWDI